MKLPVMTEIDDECCTGCGLCVTVCPSRTLELVDGKAKVTGDHSMHCGHCAAVCPTGAVTVRGVADDALTLATVENRAAWLPYGYFNTAELVRLMRSRRSCRTFSHEPVDKAILEDLVKIGMTAPSGTNSQMWTFTILPDRAAVETLGNATARFFRRLNTLAEKRSLRFLSRLFMKDILGWYHREYYDSVQEALREREETGADRLFHGATAAILVGMRPGASTPCEDALLASQNILLAAHAMGLGSCLIGFVVEAMKRDPGIKKVLRIPGEEKIYSVIALGYSETRFREPAGRKRVVPRYFEG
ncbi:MAG: nitroreductase family protein [Deltaproteobacteria bacterium]|nr:nitroreductase family protein [Deltaproteobacteria bacterium]